MKALSIHQPWAFLIVTGRKDVENRSWPTKLRGRIYIHASKHVDWAAMTALGIPLTNCHMGAIIGEVDITGCVTESGSPWFEGPYGFTLSRPVMYDSPVPYRGEIRFFEVDLYHV